MHQGAIAVARSRSDASRAQNYFADFFLFFFAAARRSAFLRRTARFLTLSLP
jgi:hypothetical protein